MRKKRAGRGCRLGVGDVPLAASPLLARSSWLVARSFFWACGLELAACSSGGQDDECEGGVGGHGADGSGVARGGGPGVVGGHAQASLERGTRTTRVTRHASGRGRSRGTQGAGGGPRGWDEWDGWDRRKTSLRSRVKGKLRATSRELRARREESKERAAGYDTRLALLTRHATRVRKARQARGAPEARGGACALRRASQSP